MAKTKSAGGAEVRWVEAAGWGCTFICLIKTALFRLFNRSVNLGDTGTGRHTLLRRGGGATHRFTVEAARLIGQRALEDLVNPGGLRLVVRLGLGADGGAIVLQPSVLLLLLLLLLQDVGHRVQQVVEELVGVLLHVIVKEVWKQKQMMR